jgi:hypothetical protein
VSTADTVTEGFTRVPQSLLRGEARFDEPLDFMVYMHLFTFSYGFGRREAHMSQAQLERFTGAAKNTIKRSLERLAAKGWIKCIEEYECARMSRKWRVMSPEDRPGRGGPGSKRTVSKPEAVQVEPGSPRTGGLSGADTLTVSKTAPYKERDPKEKTKNSLSAEVPALRDYFAEVKPFAKKESEWRAFQGLRRDFSEEQVAACVEHLQEKGVPGSGAPCHSPIGFLSKAMGQVLVQVQAEAAHRAEAEARVRAEAESIAKRQQQDEAAERDARQKEEAFYRAFPSQEAQTLAFSQFGARYPMLSQTGPMLKGLAINAWWEEQNAASSYRDIQSLAPSDLRVSING